MIKVGNKYTPPFFKGEKLSKLQCTDISNMGYGVLKYNNFTIFAKGLIIGEVADVSIEKISKSFAIAKVLNVYNKSKDRVEPPCDFAKDCNGCKYQHMTYSRQIKVKEKQLRDLFCYNVEVIGAKDQFNYRNKVSFTVKNNVFNMYDANHKLVEIDQCIIAHPSINKIMPFLLEAINNNKKAEIKEVVFRYSQYQDALMIVLVSDVDNFFSQKIAQEIVGYSSQVKSVILNVGSSKNYLFNDFEKLLYGQEYLIDRLYDKLYKITSKSFYQVNQAQTKELYDTVIEFGQFKETDNVLDLYCGVATIAITIADYVNHVEGVEILAAAVDSAKDNINLNDISNVEIFKQDLKDDLEIKDNIDCIIVDPPRAGLNPSIINNIINSEVNKLIYVSCNPITQKRDLKTILEAGFKVKEHKAVDMFVNTEHIESVILLKRS